MFSKAANISNRGTVTIPPEVREKLGTPHILFKIEGANCIIEPLKTKEEFLAELDEAEKDWEKNGGTSLEEIEGELGL